MAPVRKTSPKRTEEDSSASPLLPLRRKPFLLLHICCGPCSTHVIDLLKDKYHPIGFFYNPNLHPKTGVLQEAGGYRPGLQATSCGPVGPPFRAGSLAGRRERPRQGTGGRQTMQYLHSTQAGGNGMGGKSCLHDGLCNDPDHKPKEKQPCDQCLRD